MSALICGDRRQLVEFVLDRGVTGAGTGELVLEFDPVVVVAIDDRDTVFVADVLVMPEQRIFLRRCQRRPEVVQLRRVVGQLGGAVEDGLHPGAYRRPVRVLLIAGELLQVGGDRGTSPGLGVAELGQQILDAGLEPGRLIVELLLQQERQEVPGVGSGHLGCRHIALVVDGHAGARDLVVDDVQQGGAIAG